MEKVIKGQTVWMLYVRISRTAESELKEAVVTKVGNKYFYVECVGGYPKDKKFAIENLREVTDSNYSSRIYLSKEVYEAEQKRSRELKYIKDIFSYSFGKSHSLTDKQISEIYTILQPTTNTP